MTPTAMAVTDLLNTLEEEDYKSAIRYIQFLSVSRKQDKAKESKEALEELQNMFADLNTGWNTEEDMIMEMADFRRRRLGL